MAWRLAKGAATRYLSPEGASPVEAREVVRRYVAALRETSVVQGQDLLAGFRLTRKAAQSLGEFGDIAAQSGMAAALEVCKLTKLAEASPEMVIPGFISVWLKDQDGLEAEVVRTALASCLGRVFGAGATAAPELNGASLVTSFLAIFLCQRLAFDLGESLEAAAPGWREYQQGLARLENEVKTTFTEIPVDPPGVGQWQGLAGWLWVTQTLEKMLLSFQDRCS